jgi:proteasome assembly chaperone (PAC2) family protein
MGHVALNAGVFLLAKLHMTAIAEFESGDLFDIDHVEVKRGLVQPARRPRNRFFVWEDPAGKHDLVLFLGEAQPPLGKYAFCRQLVAYAKQLGVERVFTFAAMATRMHPADRSRVFAAATDRVNLDELMRLELDLLEDGNIGGLNGVLLGAAAEAGLPGACLLGEMPHVFAQLPFPKASLAILESFVTIAGLELDMSELAEQSKALEEQLTALIEHAEEQGEEGEEAEEGDEAEDEEEPEAPEPPADIVSEGEREKIDRLFTAATQNRSKAFELKKELDRLGLFKEYEDRFLDLFTRPGKPGGPAA